MLEWRAFMGRHCLDGDPRNSTNLDAYLTAQTMVRILKACGNDLTRENVMRQATSIKALKLPLMMPGLTLNSSPSDYVLVKQAQLSRFNGKLWEGFGDVLSTAG